MNLFGKNSKFRLQRGGVIVYGHFAEDEVGEVSGVGVLEFFLVRSIAWKGCVLFFI